MLELLHIENIAVIERADIELSSGFNVLTGETGAGKSIVIDSINAILGARTSRDLVRTGATRASVTGSFRAEGEALLTALSSLGVVPDEDGFIVLHRDINADGRGSCRINGVPVSVAVLREAGGMLVSIHGQHDNQRLMNENLHLSLLDRLADSRPMLDEYVKKYNAMRAAERELKALETDEKTKAQRIDMLKYQIAELEDARLDGDEEPRLEERRRILQNASRLSESINAANVLLYGDDTEAGAVANVKRALRELERCSGVSADIDSLTEELADINERLRDAADDVLSMTDRFEYNEAELDNIEGRLDQLSRLKKKYGNTVEAMLKHLESCKEELDKIENSDALREKLEKELDKLRKEAEKAAEKLSEHRKARAKELEKAITGELKYLDMPRAGFITEFTKIPLCGDGCDKVVFLISVNAGEAPKSLSKIASGGELSRIMLALQSILASADDIETMIFDEIDTGVSGRAAQKVAEKLAGVATKKQVICVTHSTQLAAMADRHMLIEKGEKNGRTYTQVRPLDEDGRCGELARITSGAKITDSALENARELIHAAVEYKLSIKQ